MTKQLHTLTPAACVFTALLLAASPASAQTAGVEGGVTFSTFDFQTPAPGTSTITGATGGLFFTFSDDTITGMIEVLYGQHGTKLDGGGEITLDYLEIPVGTRINLVEGQNGNFHVIAGGTFAFKVRDSQTTDEIFEIPDQDINSFDSGLFAGVGFEAQRFIANVRYVWGVRDLSDRAVELYNRSFSIMVGVKLN